MTGNRTTLAAAEQYKEAVRIATSFDSQEALAGALLNAEKLDEAEKIIHELVKLYPKVVGPQTQLAYLQVSKKQYADAIETLKLIEKLSPDNSFPHRELSHVYEEMGKHDEAIREGEAAVLMDPRDWEAYTFLGTARASEKHYDAAITSYRSALAIEQNNATPHLDLGEVLIKMGKKDEGRAELKLGLALKHTDEQTKAAQALLDKNP